ncbi:MAG TPA: DUF6537 domain-containing protein, partial [Phenylobacterium sp.]
VRYDGAAFARRVAAAVKSFDACPAQTMAETRLGDAIFANMIMLGFAWQKGVVPVSSRALYRAIRLNGVQAEANLQAFEMGRLAAYDPSTRGAREADVPTPDTMPLVELIAHRADELSAYQDRAYAEQYLGTVRKVEAAGHEPLTRAAAISLYKLMAYKDEYEVARLYSDGRFKAYRDQTFEGGKDKIWLAPPVLGRKDGEGRPKKSAFGSWMLSLGFPTLAKFKRLRGTPLDPFGHTEERRLERALIGQYRATLERLLAELTPERLPTAVKLAALPQQIRGFGHIKLASLEAAKAEEAKLWTEWERS